MKNRYLDKITYSAFSRGEPMILSVFFFLTGIASGASFSVIMSPSGRSAVLDFVTKYFSEGNAVTYPPPFFYTIGINIFFLAVIAISGRFAFGFFLCFLALIAKGMTLGFVCALLLGNLKLQGFLWVIMAVMPQNILIVPAFIIAGIVALTHSFALVTHLHAGEKKNRFHEAGPYIFVYSALCAAVIFAGIIESFFFLIIL